ncbi:hypothetical protein PR048_014576 [Dryococelus australis]|uniref:Uncharacterized protein n=1 Tax=Dryococelus australis TaxID=614101 RepID=A0ABQ9HEM1_9NEOP|nr:hypothetical protein PR048_014576 [Dryococelus australis]
MKTTYETPVSRKISAILTLQNPHILLLVNVISQMVRQLAFHIGELALIPGGVVPRFSHVGNRTGRCRWSTGVFSGISRFPQTCIPALFHAHLTSLLSANIPTPLKNTEEYRSGTEQPLMKRTPDARANILASLARKTVGTPLANQRLVTYSPAGRPYEREPFTAGSSQSDNVRYQSFAHSIREWSPAGVVPCYRSGKRPYVCYLLYCALLAPINSVIMKQYSNMWHMKVSCPGTGDVGIGGSGEKCSIVTEFTVVGFGSLHKAPHPPPPPWSLGFVKECHQARGRTGVVVRPLGSIAGGVAPPDFRTWKSCRMMSLVSGFSPVPPPSPKHFGAAPSFCVPSPPLRPITSFLSFFRSGMELPASHNFIPLLSQPLASNNKVVVPPPQPLPYNASHFPADREREKGGVSLRYLAWNDPSAVSNEDIEGWKNIAVRRRGCRGAGFCCSRLRDDRRTTATSLTPPAESSLIRGACTETFSATSFIARIRMPRPILTGANCTVKRHDGNTARPARRSDEALELHVSTAPALLDLGRADTCFSFQFQPQGLFHEPSTGGSLKNERYLSQVGNFFYWSLPSAVYRKGHVLDIARAYTIVWAKVYPRFYIFLRLQACLGHIPHCFQTKNTLCALRRRTIPQESNRAFDYRALTTPRMFTNTVSEHSSIAKIGFSNGQISKYTSQIHTKIIEGPSLNLSADFSPIILTGSPLKFRKYVQHEENTVFLVEAMTYFMLVLRNIANYAPNLTANGATIYVPCASLTTCLPYMHCTSQNSSEVYISYDWKHAEDARATADTECLNCSQSLFAGCGFLGYVEFLVSSWFAGRSEPPQLLCEGRGAGKNQLLSVEKKCTGTQAEKFRQTLENQNQNGRTGNQNLALPNTRRRIRRGFPPRDNGGGSCSNFPRYHAASCERPTPHSLLSALEGTLHTSLKYTSIVAHLPPLQGAEGGSRRKGLSYTSCPPAFRGRGDVVVRPLSPPPPPQGELVSIPDGVIPGLVARGNCDGSCDGRRVSSGMSHSPPPSQSGAAPSSTYQDEKRRSDTGGFATRFKCAIACTYKAYLTGVQRALLRCVYLWDF